MRVLIVEDNSDLAANIGDYLEMAGHTVDFAEDGRHGLALAERDSFDIMVRGLALPRIDGIDLCSRLRAGGHALPVLMLTARDTLDDKLVGFGAGADDYLVKPFSQEELLARLTALHRRAVGARDHDVLRVRDLEYDPATLRTRRGGSDLMLNPAQRRLLEALLRHSERVMSRGELERVLWGDDPPDSDALRAHIHLLRNAIDRGHEIKLLQTVQGVGYRLADPDDL